MTPENFKKLRLRTKLSPQKSAELVHISKRSWSRYEKGDRDVPEGIVHLFCLMTQITYPPNFDNHIITINTGNKSLVDTMVEGNKKAAAEDVE